MLHAKVGNQHPARCLLYTNLTHALARHFGRQEDIQFPPRSTQSSLEDLKGTSMITDCTLDMIDNQGVTETLRGVRIQKSTRAPWAQVVGELHGGERLLRPNLKR